MKSNHSNTGIALFRILIASWICVFHSAIIFSNSTPENWPKDNTFVFFTAYEGYVAVSMFIVLSGYLLAERTKSKKINWKLFYLHRLKILYPAYLIVIAISTFKNFNGFRNLFFDLMMIPRLPTNMPPANEFNATTWSLRVEFLCYFFLPLIMRLKKYLITLVLVGYLIITSTIIILHLNAMDVVYWSPIGRLIEFTIGAAFSINKSRIRASKIKFIVLPILYFSLYLVNQNGGEWKIGEYWPLISSLSCAAAGFAIIFLERSNIKFKFSSSLSQLTYHLYLIHFAVIINFKNLLVPSTQVSPVKSTFLGIFFILPISILAAKLLQICSNYISNFFPKNLNYNLK